MEINDQVDSPLDKGDTHTLTEQTSLLLLLLSSEERKSSSSSRVLFSEDVKRAKNLMAAYLLPGGGCLSYILERRAFTIPVVESATGVSPKTIFSVVRRLIQGGVAHVRYRVGGHGRPVNLYALFDASDGQVEEAAALYRDQNATHIKRLEDYTAESIYHKVAEEVATHHLIQGMASKSAVAIMLYREGLEGDEHLFQVHRILYDMGYQLVAA